MVLFCTYFGKAFRCFLVRKKLAKSHPVWQSSANSTITLFVPRTTDTQWLNPWFFVAQIQIPIRNQYLGFGYKGIVFCRSNCWLSEKMDKELTVPKWVLIHSSAENTPNAPEFICPICLPKPKSSGFQWKKASLCVRSPWIQSCPK